MKIALTNVSVSFPGRDKPALDDVTLSIAEGEHVVLLGPSGSGKTTLLRSVCGAVLPRSGRIRVDGMDPTSTKQARAIRLRTGMVRQGDDLVLGLRAQTNALLGTAPGWGPRDWAAVLLGAIPRPYREPLLALAHKQDIHPYLRSRVEHLSGGQRQRVALVRAVLPQPRLLLADEPTSGLDPATAQVAVDTLRAADGVTVLVCTHDLTVARQFPRVVALREGRISFDGPDLSDHDAREIYHGTGVSA